MKCWIYSNVPLSVSYLYLFISRQWTKSQCPGETKYLEIQMLQIRLLRSTELVLQIILWSLLVQRHYTSVTLSVIYADWRVASKQTIKIRLLQHSRLHYNVALVSIKNFLCPANLQHHFDRLFYYVNSFWPLLLIMCVKWLQVDWVFFKLYLP